MSKVHVVLVGVSAAIIGFGSGWVAARLPGHKGQAPEQSAVVVRHGAVTVTAAELKAALSSEGGGNGQVTPPAMRKRIAGQLLRERVLAARAESDGLDMDPAVAKRVRLVLAEALVERELKLAATTPSDVELKAYFEAHHAEFSSPPRLRVAHILVAATKNAPDRGAKRKRAADLVDNARRLLETDYYAFGALARERSEDAETRPFGGELPWMTDAEFEDRFGKEALASVQPLAVGAVIPAPLETQSGFHVVRLIGRDPGSNPSYEQLADTIRARVIAERQEAKRAELFGSIENSPQTIWDDATLANL